jgi:hypothetical protein
MESLPFINEKILKRLIEGSFVPERRSNPGKTKLADRRDTISPLAVAKRCVRYEPQVFYQRKDLVLRVADHLNNSTKKMVLVTGQQGSGKTSLVRGVVELMGGGDEQLLWFDINIHTDFDEIIQFLIENITYICAALSIDEAPKEGVSPLKAGPLEPMDQLEYHLRKVSHIPLLIVVDNIEYIVDPEYRIHSYSLKEFLNFLLSFPNIKMVLLGDRLPYADISVTEDIVTELKLYGLKETDGLQLLRSNIPQNGIEKEADFVQTCTQLFRRTGGAPWQLRALNFWTQKKQIPVTELAAFLSKPGISPADSFAQFLQGHLTQEEQKVFTLLSFLRHPVDVRLLNALMRRCYWKSSRDSG